MISPITSILIIVNIALLIKYYYCLINLIILSIFKYKLLVAHSAHLVAH